MNFMFGGMGVNPTTGVAFPETKYFMMSQCILLDFVVSKKKLTQKN